MWGRESGTLAGGPVPPTEAGLVSFRRELYGCLHGWADSLFELSDAVLCAAAPVASLPALSLEPEFRRSHGSLYKALARGSINDEGLRDLLVAYRPARWPAVFAVDASAWPRADADTSPQRGFCYRGSRQPVVAGWQYQWISQLDWAPDSWTAPLDVGRLLPAADHLHDTVAQISALVERLPRDGPTPMFVFDAGYDPIALTEGLHDLRAAVLVRLRGNRVFYDDPEPVPPGTRGRPRRHGRRFACADPTTWRAPDQHLTLSDDRYGHVDVRAWHRLHPQLLARRRRAGTRTLPIVAGTIIRVDVEHLPKPAGRAVKTLWLWAAGPDPIDLDTVWRAYLRRFDIEHTFRFAKHTLGWTTPAVCTPEQADRWTWLIVAAYTQLRLARELIVDQRLPWERPQRPDQLTPARVRRGFRRLAATLTTPARSPKSTVAGPGRPTNTRRPPRTRHPPIRKTPLQV